MAYNICEGLSIPATNFIDSSVVSPKFSNVTPMNSLSEYEIQYCMMCNTVCIGHVTC